jgi:hypothetical protein
LAAKLTFGIASTRMAVVRIGRTRKPIRRQIINYIRNLELKGESWSLIIMMNLTKQGQFAVKIINL